MLLVTVALPAPWEDELKWKQVRRPAAVTNAWAFGKKANEVVTTHCFRMHLFFLTAAGNGEKNMVMTTSQNRIASASRKPSSSKGASTFFKTKHAGAVLLALIVLYSPLAHAQQKDSLKHVIPEVTVTATRIPEDPNTVSRSVTVVSNEEIKKLQPQDLAQLLSMLPGISVTGAGENPGMTETVFTRGTNSNHTLIMIDGVRITDPSSVNGSLDLAELPLSGLEKAEVILGSHSTLYGSSCIGGVINLFTHGLQPPGLHADVEVRGGVFGKQTSLLSENIHLNYSFRQGFYVNADFYNRSVHGLDATVDTITNPNAFKSFDQDGMNLLKASVKMGFENAVWKVFASFGYTNEKTDFDKTGWKYNNPYGPNPLAYYDGDSTRIFTERSLFSYHVSHQFSNRFSLSLSGGYTALMRHTIDDSSKVNDAGLSDHTFSFAQYRGTNGNHDLQATLSFKNLNVIGGLDWMRETMSDSLIFFTNTFYGPYLSTSDLDTLNLHDDIAGIYTQAELKGALITPKLSPLHLTAGARYNHHNLFGSNFNYELNPSWHFAASTLIYASFSSGFNAPSLYQLYAPELYYTSAITRGNPYLQPEISHTFELGYKQQLGDHFNFSIALYRNVIENEIEFVYLWDNKIPVDSLGTDFSRDDYRGDTYLNVGTLYSNGAEVTFSSVINKYFSVSGNVNLVDGKLDYDATAVDTAHIPGSLPQLYNNGDFLVGHPEVIGLTRRPSTANLFVTINPFNRASLKLITRWTSSHTDIYYDSDLGPYGALSTVPIESYTLFDVLLHYGFTGNIGATLKVENMLNTGFTDLRGFTARGRGFYLSLQASF